MRTFSKSDDTKSPEENIFKKPLNEQSIAGLKMEFESKGIEKYKDILKLLTDTHNFLLETDTTDKELQKARNEAKSDDDIQLLLTNLLKTLKEYKTKTSQ